MEYKVSIVVPVYNAEKYLDRCMKTLLEQSMPKGEYEIILVDDGSPDASGKICDNYAKDYDFVTVYIRKTPGRQQPETLVLPRRPVNMLLLSIQTTISKGNTLRWLTPRGFITMPI